MSEQCGLRPSVIWTCGRDDQGRDSSRRRLSNQSKMSQSKMSSRFRARSHRIITALIFFCCLVSFFERMAFSIAFTAIADEIGLTETEKGFTIASYFFGFTVSQIPGAYLTKRYGGKNTLGLSFFLWTPLSAVLAASTRSGYSVAVVVACRLGIGLALGVFLPAAHSVLGRWTPPARRGRHFALAFSGFFAGAAIAMVTVPQTVSRYGGYSTFYISAVLGVAWLAVWVCAGSDGPPRETAAAVFDPAAQQHQEGWEGAAVGTADTRPVSEDDLQGERGDDDHWGEAGFGLERNSEDWAFRNPSAAAAAATAAVADSAPWVTVNTRLWGSNTGKPPPPPPRVFCEGRSGRVESCSPSDVKGRTCSVEDGCGCLGCCSESVVARGCFAGPGSGLLRHPPCGGPADVSGCAGGGKPGVEAYFFGSGRPPGSAVLGGRPTAGIAGNASAAAAAAAATATRQNGGEDDAQSDDLCYSSSSSSGSVGGREEPDDSLFTGGSFHERLPARSPLRLSPTPPPLPSKTTATAASGNLGRLDAPADGSLGRAAGTDTAGVNNIWTNGSASGGYAFRGKNGAPVGTGTATAAATAAAAKDSTLGVPCRRSEVALDVSSRRGQVPDVSSRPSQVKYPPFPWKAMSVSSAAWACVAGNVGAGIAINVVMSWLPTYYEEFILVDLGDLSIGTLLSPYLTMTAFSILGGFAYGWLTNSRGLPRARASKILAGSAFALCLGAFPSMGLARSPAGATLLSSLALAGAALSRGGWSTKHVEIACPEHAAMLYSLANSFSAAASVFGISVTGRVLDSLGGGGEAAAWTAAMGTIGTVSGACGVAFVLFARGDEVLFPVAVDAAAPGVLSRRVGVGAGGCGGPGVEMAGEANPDASV